MIKNILRIWFWEFVQNTPLIMAFTFGYQFFLAKNMYTALMIVLIGVGTGALLIRFTESRIDKSSPESWRETFTNMFFFSLAINLFFIYFNWIPGSPPLDILTGIAVGFLASISQAAAGKTSLSLQHTAALSVSFAVALLLIRGIIGVYAPLPAAILVNLPVTTLIVIIEYRSGFKPTGSEIKQPD